MHPHSATMVAGGCAGLIVNGISDLWNFRYWKVNGPRVRLLIYSQATAYWGLQFGLYDTLQPRFIGDGYNFPGNFMLGIATTAISSYTIAPISETRRILSQKYYNQPRDSKKQITIRTTIHSIYKKSGIRGFFRIPNYSSIAVGAGYLAFFELVKEFVDC